MAEVQHLREAPIVEAMIDVRIEARPEFRADVFHEIRAKLEPTFPVVEERRGVTFHLAFGGAQPEQETPQLQGQMQQQQLDGLFFRSADGKDVAQFRGDGFTFNRLPPYTHWDEILPQALTLLEDYLRLTAPRAITRVAVRYINRLRFPSFRFDEYLTGPPRSAPGTQGALAGFMEAALVDVGGGVMVNFTQALEAAAPGAESPTVLLDIDAFRADAFEPDLDEVKARLDVLHDLKNIVFFGALTDTAVRFYQ